MKNFHKMGPPPPNCICEILIQIFTVNELVYDIIPLPVAKWGLCQSTIYSKLGLCDSVEA